MTLANAPFFPHIHQLHHCGINLKISHDIRDTFTRAYLHFMCVCFVRLWVCVCFVRLWVCVYFVRLWVCVGVCDSLTFRYCIRLINRTH